MAIGRVADTSWLYALFNQADVHHDDATADVTIPQVTLVPTAIMNEFLDLVRYRLGKDAAARALDALQDFPHFDLWYPTEEKEAVAVWTTHPHLSMHDAHVVACARTAGFELASFDNRQKAVLS